jgi:3'-phosphoadenosine 5'-phosphosulfate sulfotransferase (PAPS reductase)/FAD synthetase
MFLKKTEFYKKFPVIAWWSGGVTSAVTCWLCTQWYGIDNMRIIFIDTHNEDDDTYRFKNECQNWYKKEIETISSIEYFNPEEVWYQFLSFHAATGANCSTYLKRRVREQFERTNNYSFQAFGFDIDEIKRAKGMKSNNPNSKPIFPLIAELLTKKDCIKIIQKANDLFLKIEIPNTYKLGYLNNNCWKTGCVQGGIGYWQKIQNEFPDKFERMAKHEHKISEIKGKPVTILKDQSKNGGLVFLKHNPKYPELKDLSMMKGQQIQPLIECNGFCGFNDLQPYGTENEINYEVIKS